MDLAIRTIRDQLQSKQTGSSAIQIILSSIFRKQLAMDWLIRVVTVLLPALFLTAVVFQPWVDAKWMFLDPLTAAELSTDCCHSHYGFVSTAGVILWAVTAATSLLCAAVLAITRSPLKIVLFPLLAGLLTTWLTLDDAFLLHETVLPAFGVPQNGVLALYVLLAGAYFWTNWKNIFKYDFWILGMGAAALATSLAVDTIFHSLEASLVLLEDSAKFFGIFCWTSFHVTTFAKILVAKIDPKLETQDG